MEWSGISYKHRPPLIFINGSLWVHRYVDVILRPLFVPFVHRHNVTFQQDNARVHVAQLNIGFRHQIKSYVMHWPPYNPGLSPIRHL